MNKFLLLVVINLVWISTLLNAQNSPNQPGKVYKSPDGKVYVQKSLPVYLFISTSKEPHGEVYRLESDSTKAYTNPMYLDTEGYNTFRSPSAVDTVTKQMVSPLTDVVFELYADSRSPVSRLAVNASQKYYNGKVLFLGKNAKVELSATDDGSGIEQVLYSIDSANFTHYTEPLIFPDEKSFELRYYAEDHVGNSETIKHKLFTVDLTSPVSRLIIDGDQFEQIISGRTKLELKAEDASSGVADLLYSIDSSKFLRYYHPILANNMVEGEHIISYYSVDKVGNQEQVKSYSFYIDKTPPILVDEIMGSSFVVNGREYSSGRTKLKLTAVDNKSGIREIKYSINNEPYVDYEKPFYLTTVSGSLSVISFAIDNVGNKSSASEKSTRNRAAYVDLTGPQLFYSFAGKMFKTRDTLFINKDTRIELKAKDNESGLHSLSYSIGEGAENQYTAPFSIVDEGPQVLNIYGYDNVDNSNRETINLVVDNTGPDIYFRFSILPIGKKEVNNKQVDIYSSQAVLFLSATDAKVAIDRIYYSVNGEAEKMYTGIIEGFKLGKDYTIRIKALDKLGNVKNDSVVFATDNTGPQVFVRFSVHPVETIQENGQAVDVYPTHVSLFISVTNAFVAYDKIYYSINGGSEKLYQGIIDGFKAGSSIKMRIRALDRLGNQTEKELFFNIQSD